MGEIKRRRPHRGLLLAANLLLLATLASDAGARVGESGGWYVVSYPQRITSADRAALGKIGARAIQYRPVDSYLAWLDGAALEATTGLADLAVRRLSSRDKVSPSLQGASLQTENRGLLDIVVYGPRLSEAVNALDEVTAIVRTYPVNPDGSLHNVVIQAHSRGLQPITAIPEVLAVAPAATGFHLQDEGTSQIVAGNVASGRPVVGYRQFLADHGLDGSGVRVAVVDDGISEEHPDLAGRVMTKVDYGLIPEPLAVGGHGTHVSGILGGSGVGIPDAADSDGFRYGLGVAPAVEFVDLALGHIHTDSSAPTLEQISADAYRNGAVAWNASWTRGAGTRVGYVLDARTLDVITRDADWNAPGTQPLTLVHAAGNAGTGGLQPPAEAKNIVVVASSKSHLAGDIDEIATSSSRGPTLDGRMGPTVAAPGQRVISTRSLPAGYSCNTPLSEGLPTSAFYALCSGTSMATPQVTGAVALITQWWRKAHEGATPSPAMNKALLANTATDMQWRLSDVPSTDEGWGRVTLKNLFDPGIPRVLADQTFVLGEVGETHSLQIAPADPLKALKVTVAWSDAPGAVNANPALVNDLDISLVASDGTTYLGNRFSRGTSIPDGEPDRREVLESIYVANPSGTYTLRVAAFNLPGDGVPFSGDSTDQDFALVISNAVVTSG